MKIRTGWFIPAAMAAALLVTGSAWAQKPGGVLTPKCRATSAALFLTVVTRRRNIETHRYAILLR